MAVNRERQEISVKGESLDAYCAKKPEELIEQIKNYVDYYGPSTTFEYAQEDYGDNRYIYVFYTRPETDQEMARRIEWQEKYEAQRKERDRLEFRRLKALFEGK